MRNSVQEMVLSAGSAEVPIVFSLAKRLPGSNIFRSRPQWKISVPEDSFTCTYKRLYMYL